MIVKETFWFNTGGSGGGGFGEGVVCLEVYERLEDFSVAGTQGRLGWWVVCTEGHGERSSTAASKIMVRWGCCVQRVWGHGGQV